MSTWMGILLLVQFGTLALVLFFGLRKSQDSEKSELLLEKFRGLLGENNQVFLERYHQNSEAILTKLSEQRERQQESLYNFKEQLQNVLNKDFESLNKNVEARLDKISLKVQENLTQGLDKTQKTLTDLIARLAKIDEAQKKIESLSTEVVSLQDVLTDKKSRGIFGEVQLKHLLETVFGENNQKAFSLQFSLSNQKIADAVLHLPEPLGLVCIDSKFPLENYRLMLDKSLENQTRQEATKNFVRDVKKHIDAIADKYIIPQETSDQAILFLPAEAIFAEIHAYHPELIDYAHKRRVWASSPTTFMATLTSLQTVMLNLERSKYMTLMHEEINKLGQDFERFEQRWNNLSKHIGNVQKDVSDIHISSQKISGRFKKIRDVEIDEADAEKRGELPTT